LAAKALTSLQDIRHAAIRDVFGAILKKRATATEPDCTLFQWLAHGAFSLDLLNKDCAVYVRELGLGNARQKCATELDGKARGPKKEFNGAFADFWSEMAAISELYKRGYRNFCPLRTRHDVGTSDYSAVLHEKTCHIEVKNMRTNETVFDIFDLEIRRLFHLSPAEYSFTLEVNYDFDNRPTGDQAKAVRAFVSSLRGKTPPFHETLQLDEGIAKINVTAGSGTAFMTRNSVSDSPEPLSRTYFLNRVRDKAEEARAQMKHSPHSKVLVLNFDPPAGSLTLDLVDDAVATMRNVFEGEIDAYFLFYRR